MDSKKSSNKISEIVRLQLMLKKWKKLAKARGSEPKNTTKSSNVNDASSNVSGGKSIKFLKKTLSFSDSSSSSSIPGSNNDVVVPKGFLAVCVGKELKRFVIPTDYLGHQAFGVLLREAEEEFGFQQEGVLKIPCEVPLFEKILKMVQDKKDAFFLHDFKDMTNNSFAGCFSPDHDLDQSSHSNHPQLCR
ncbi:hypothetical protein NMG60_11008223 [Bertholletia excelsa]